MATSAKGGAAQDAKGGTVPAPPPPETEGEGQPHIVVCASVKVRGCLGHRASSLGPSARSTVQ